MAFTFGDGAPMGLKLEEQRAWVSFRRMRTARNWLLAFPDLQEIKVWWGGKSWTSVSRTPEAAPEGKG